MPPSATTTGPPAGPARRQAIDTDSSVPPKCSFSSPGTASTPSRTCTPLTAEGAVSTRETGLLSLLIGNAPPRTQLQPDMSSRADLHGTPTTPAWSEEAAHLPELLLASSAGVGTFPCLRRLPRCL